MEPTPYASEGRAEYAARPELLHHPSSSSTSSSRALPGQLDDARVRTQLWSGAPSHPPHASSSATYYSLPSTSQPQHSNEPISRGYLDESAKGDMRRISGVGQFLDALGLGQYFDVFFAEGFNNFQTLVDIQESDLDFLQVRRGDRRVIQRQLAAMRGIAPTTALYLNSGRLLRREDEGAETASSRAYSSSIPAQSTPHKQFTAKRGPSPVSPVAAAESKVPSKRPYKRHPRPDPHAPPKPQSAYVKFSNIAREELKGRSFTDIARLVGEKWQALDRDSKEELERESIAAKDAYQILLTAYKMTNEYGSYQAYLVIFKDKQAQLDPNYTGPAVRASPERERFNARVNYESSTSSDLTSVLLGTRPSLRPFPVDLEDSFSTFPTARATRQPTRSASHETSPELSDMDSPPPQSTSDPSKRPHLPQRRSHSLLPTVERQQGSLYAESERNQVPDGTERIGASMKRTRSTSEDGRAS